MTIHQQARSSAQVSYNMSRIRSHGTRIERHLGSAMWAAGLRYRKQYPILGKPDFAFPRARIAIFCDSEFWHGYGWSESSRNHFHHNRSFWVSKIEANIKRDIAVNQQLANQGWHVLRFWGKDILSNAQECVDLVVEQLALRLPALQSKPLRISSSDTTVPSEEGIHSPLRELVLELADPMKHMRP